MKSLMLSFLVSILSLQAHAIETKCDTNKLKNGNYYYFEQEKIRANVKLKHLALSGEIELQVTNADSFSSFQDGIYKIIILPTSEIYPHCILSVFNSRGEEIVPLSNPEIPMHTPFSSTVSIGYFGETMALHMFTSGFTGCGGEGGSGNCAPVEGILFQE